MSAPRPVVTDGAPLGPPQAAVLAEAIAPDLLHWVVLRAAGPLVAASDGWREQGRRLCPYLAELDPED